MAKNRGLVGILIDDNLDKHTMAVLPGNWSLFLNRQGKKYNSMHGYESMRKLKPEHNLKCAYKEWADSDLY